MKLVVTIYEQRFENAIAAIRALPPDHDMVELRVDAFGGTADFDAVRAATSKPMIFTNRGGDPVDAPFGLIDVEYGRAIKQPERTVLSFHDFDRLPDLEPLIRDMMASRCTHTKIAVTPKNLRENETILGAQRAGLTLFGMGERGLYSRILAPFLGSELAFAGNAAPGQLSLERALAIYGDRRLRKIDHVFAVVGNPAGHSLSPSIHNPLFRQHGVPAAYTIASVESFDEVIEPFTAGRLAGMSVTAPFKEDALRFAERIGAKIAVNASEARAVNTLVRTKSGVIADNTDVDGFEILFHGARGKRAAVVGAGGTARAALVALRRAGVAATVYNRTAKDGALPLDTLMQFDGDIIINTLPAGVEVSTPEVETIIETSYSGQRTAESGQQLLQAQAIRQNELFLRAFR